MRSRQPITKNPGSPVERELLEQLTLAYEAGDLDGIVSLLTEDVWLTMPPLPFEYQGRELTARFLEIVAFRPGRASSKETGAPCATAIRDAAAQRSRKRR